VTDRVWLGHVKLRAICNLSFRLVCGHKPETEAALLGFHNKFYISWYIVETTLKGSVAALSTVYYICYPLTMVSRMSDFERSLTLERGAGLSLATGCAAVGAARQTTTSSSSEVYRSTIPSIVKGDGLPMDVRDGMCQRSEGIEA